jgi:hypothetical protein
MPNDDDGFLFVDIFADDEASRQVLEDITAQLVLKTEGQLFEYTAKADDDQRACAGAWACRCVQEPGCCCLGVSLPKEACV